MAREGLRVLVVAKKSLAEEQYQDFEVSGFCDFPVGLEPRPPRHLPSLPSALAQANVISEHTSFFSLPRTLLPRGTPWPASLAAFGSQLKCFLLKPSP